MVIIVPAPGHCLFSCLRIQKSYTHLVELSYSSQSVECPLQGTEGHEYCPCKRHTCTKDVQNVFGCFQ